jgi:Glycosyl transferases group 1
LLATGRDGVIGFLSNLIRHQQLKQPLHIICLDVPYPPDYGGVFDLFYKLVALHEAGIGIHLHCFEYGRGRQEALNQYCESVTYYERFEGHKGFSTRLPYIVSSRANPLLIENLLKDDHPILMEGVHCSYYLQDERLQGRRIILRLHNVEYAYYKELKKSTPAVFKKLYYHNESRLLHKYEAAIANKAQVLTVSEKDATTYREEFGATRVDYLPVFTPFTEITATEGIGSFCLFHGNLSVAENEKAALWLLEEVFHELKVPFVVAGKNPSARLNRVAHAQMHTCLVANPGEKEMQDMIAKAQINIIPSFNHTGIKLKLLNALYNGRHCVVNEATVEGTGLASACHIGSNADALQQIVAQLFHHPFTEDEIVLRKSLLYPQFNNAENARRLIQYLH